MDNSQPNKIICLTSCVVGMAKHPLNPNDKRPLLYVLATCEEGKLWKKLYPLGEEDNVLWEEIS